MATLTDSRTKEQEARKQIAELRAQLHDYKAKEETAQKQVADYKIKEEETGMEAKLQAARGEEFERNIEARLKHLEGMEARLRQLETSRSSSPPAATPFTSPMSMPVSLPLGPPPPPPPTSVKRTIALRPGGHTPEMVSTMLQAAKHREEFGRELLAASAGHR